MTAAVVGEFTTEAALRSALARAAEDNRAVLDAFAPYGLDGVDLGPQQGSGLARNGLVGGLLAAAGLFGLEWWTAVFAYPINSGSRPLNSWPVFLLAPFEVGILAAGVAGFATLLVRTGLPRLNHPAFEVQAFERASQDRFFLALAEPGDEQARHAAIRFLMGQGALRAQAVEL